MSNELRIKVFLSRGARDDLKRMDARSRAHPHGEQAALLEATIIMLHRLNGRRHPTKPLDYNEHFADLSDCDSTYVGADPYEKPPLRIVSRDIAPEKPGGITRREIVAIGQRRDSEVYRIAGARLGRPVGVTLDELDRQIRTQHSTAPQSQRSSQPSTEPAPEVDDSPQLG